MSFTIVTRLIDPVFKNPVTLDFPSARLSLFLH